ncbi:hypothetical protein [Solidesulfovibrio carbinolicus]|jgi:hypothetical protein|uniref:Chromosome partitioning protein ParB n=1 Tax=Solidesulfovibrio carbinolicus TaxID=296842 RepID=A0A4P6HGQ4_9BACT|nr:hypothetical protein [Solidesulfovibrio carbinolicus]QAZ66137.1 hypothetical protein C3Y92_02315 [Solidesulfovibrio carbinolicus]HML53213.1 hypothetical protein [Solidesulfovibrio magneticus]
MSTKKRTAALSSGLVAVKGQAVVDPDAPARNLENEPTDAASKASSSPLNFKVDEAFRRRFRLRAAGADLKLNELLRQALDAWEEKHLK